MLLATLVVPLRFVLLLLVGGGIWALGRWSSRIGSYDRTGAPSNVPTPDAADDLIHGEPSAKVWPPSAEQVAASLPFDPALGNLRIRKLYFKKADAIPGPDDPEIFADELNIELYDPESGHAWWQSYFVATPQGLAKHLREKSWRYLYAPEILVFPRYNIEEIRRAVVSRITAENELLKNKKQEEEESF